MAIRDGERHKAYLGPPLCTNEQHQGAWETIKTLAAAGLLKPVEDYDGDTAEAYADILGIRHG